MKKIFAAILVVCLCFGLYACASSANPNAKIEKALVGEWTLKEHANNPIYMYLRFEGDTVRYGTNLFGQDAPNGVWDCTYAINDTVLKLKTSDGTVFNFKIQTDGDTIRIFNDNGKEFIRAD